MGRGLQRAQGGRSLGRVSPMTSMQGGQSGYLFKQNNGLLGVTFERRFFVLDKANGIIRYYRKEGAKLAKEFVCRGALLSVLPGRLGTLEGTFCVKNASRMLILRADTGAVRSAWVGALLDAGAQNHPLSIHVAAQPVRGGNGSREVASATAIATARTSSGTQAAAPIVMSGGAACTLVPVPAGLAAGDRFQLELPDGESFTVIVPEGAGQSIEVVLPARCVTVKDSSSSLPLRHSRSNSEHTLCRRIEATVEKPPNLPLGLALAPSKTGVTTGHLIVTDVSYGGLVQLSGADFRLGDMLVSVNRKKIESLDGFVQLLRGFVGKLVFELQRVEEPGALKALLQQVPAELAPQTALDSDWIPLMTDDCLPHH